MAPPSGLYSRVAAAKHQSSIRVLTTELCKVLFKRHVLKKVQYVKFRTSFTFQFFIDSIDTAIKFTKTKQLVKNLRLLCLFLNIFC